MQAIILDINHQVVLAERQLPQMGPGEAMVALRAAALNRRDLWISKGLYPGLVPPVILGSDGCGEVVDVADASDQGWIGRRVVINPALAWGESQDYQSPEFQILGNPRNGTFASHVTIPTSALHEAPEHLSDIEAAALPLAGLTAWRALFRQAQIQPGERVLITGIGGGVAQMALLLACSLGCRVAVSSRDPEKAAEACRSGAECAINACDEQWPSHLRSSWGGVDVVIDGLGGTSFASLLQVADYGARIVVYGATAGEAERLPLRPLFWKQIKVIGSSMGSPIDFRQMLEYICKCHLHPVIAGSWPLSQWECPMKQMANGAAYGKLVLFPEL